MQFIVKRKLERPHVALINNHTKTHFEIYFIIYSRLLFKNKWRMCVYILYIDDILSVDT